VAGVSSFVTPAAQRGPDITAEKWLSKEVLMDIMNMDETKLH